jgi:ABC-type nitrate/sulfonate/bicarbonate transport system permease component
MRVLVDTASASEIVRAQGGGEHGYGPQVISTFWHVALGEMIGIVVGLASALLCSCSRFSRNMLGAVTELGRTVPPLLFVPFAAIVLGVSDWVQIVGVALYSGLLVCLYSLAALVALPLSYSQLATLLGAGELRQVWTVRLPGILPDLLGAVRIAVSYGLGISIVAEYLASPTGIGRVMKYSMAYANVDLIVIGVIWTSVLSFVFDGVIVLVLSVFLKWTRRADLVRWLTN